MSQYLVDNFLLGLSREDQSKQNQVSTSLGAVFGLFGDMFRGRQVNHANLISFNQINSWFPEAKVRFLADLARTIGHNSRIISDLRRSIAIGEFTFTNLSARGGIADSGALRKREELPNGSIDFFAVYTPLEWLNDLALVAYACGVPEQEIFNGPIFRSFAQSFLQANPKAAVKARECDQRFYDWATTPFDATDWRGLQQTDIARLIKQQSEVAVKLLDVRTRLGESMPSYDSVKAWGRLVLKLNK